MTRSAFVGLHVRAVRADIGRADPEARGEALQEATAHARELGGVRHITFGALEHAAHPLVNEDYVLGILVLVYTLNFLDRQILGILAGPIKAELHLTDGSAWVRILLSSESFAAARRAASNAVLEGKRAFGSFASAMASTSSTSRGDLTWPHGLHIDYLVEELRRARPRERTTIRDRALGVEHLEPARDVLHERDRLVESEARSIAQERREVAALEQLHRDDVSPT